MGAMNFILAFAVHEYINALKETVGQDSKDQTLYETDLIVNMKEE